MPHVLYVICTSSEQTDHERTGRSLVGVVHWKDNGREVGRILDETAEDEKTKAKDHRHGG